MGSRHDSNLDGVQQGHFLVGIFGTSFPFAFHPVNNQKFQMISTAQVVDHEWGNKPKLIIDAGIPAQVKNLFRLAVDACDPLLTISDSIFRSCISQNISWLSISAVTTPGVRSPYRERRRMLQPLFNIIKSISFLTDIELLVEDGRNSSNNVTWRDSN